MGSVDDETRLRGRVARLERNNRRLWAAVLVLGVLAAARALGVAAAAPSRSIVIEADGFVLKGPDGTTRGEWAVDQRGDARLTLYDKDGRPVAELPTAPQRLRRADDVRGKKVTGAWASVEGH